MPLLDPLALGRPCEEGAARPAVLPLPLAASDLLARAPVARAFLLAAFLFVFVDVDREERDAARLFALFFVEALLALVAIRHTPIQRKTWSSSGPSVGWT